MPAGRPTNTEIDKRMDRLQRARAWGRMKALQQANPAWSAFLLILAERVHVIDGDVAMRGSSDELCALLDASEGEVEMLLGRMAQAGLIFVWRQRNPSSTFRVMLAYTDDEEEDDDT